MSKKRKRLSAPEFERAIARLPTMGDKRRLVARAVLVDGRKQTEVAAEFQITKGAVWQCVRKVLEIADLQDGLQRVTAILPEHQAFLVRKWDLSKKKDP